MEDFYSISYFNAFRPAKPQVFQQSLLCLQNEQQEGTMLLQDDLKGNNTLKKTAHFLPSLKQNTSYTGVHQDVCRRQVPNGFQSP